MTSKEEAMFQEIADTAIQDAEETGGPLRTFAAGLKLISVAIQERLEQVEQEIKVLGDVEPEEAEEEEDEEDEDDD